jgi:integrase
VYQVSKRRARGEGTVYKRSDGLWVAQITLSNGKRKAKYSRKQSEVKDWLLERRRQITDGVLVDDKKITFGNFLEQWFEDIAKPRLKPSTIITHTSVIKNHIQPAIGEIRLSQLSPVHLQSLYSQKLKEGLSSRTVKYIHTIIHQTLDQALKWGLVARNVSDVVDAPKLVKTPVEPLTQDQVKRLLEVLEGDRLYSFYVVSLGCGLRRGEALALTWDAVDLENGTLYVKQIIQHIIGQGLVISEPKSEKSRRVVVMPDFVKEALITHKNNQVIESEYVFHTSVGTPFYPRNIVRHFKKNLDKAGLPNHIRLHDLRHTFVSFMLAQNVPPKDVQVIAGHASFKTTMDIYGHLMPGAQQEAAKKMDKLFNA